MVFFSKKQKQNAKLNLKTLIQKQLRKEAKLLKESVKTPWNIIREIVNGHIAVAA